MSPAAAEMVTARLLLQGQDAPSCFSLLLLLQQLLLLPPALAATAAAGQSFSLNATHLGVLAHGLPLHQDLKEHAGQDRCS
jgi:hypothetical protein